MAFAEREREGLDAPIALQVVADLPYEPVDCFVSGKGGGWVRVEGLGRSGCAMALLPVKPGAGEGASLTFSIPRSPFPVPHSLLIRFLPDYRLWPGLKLRVSVSFDDAAPVAVEVPESDGTFNQHSKGRRNFVQDNAAVASVQIPQGARMVRILALDPGVVVDAVAFGK